MSNGNSFNWLAFLLGLAIGLWISVVVFFLIDDGDCDCAPGGGTVVIQSPGDRAWAPSGDANYYCINNDEGGGIVMDEGGGIVMDEGPGIIMDEGGGIVMDEGPGVVMDSGGFVPVPGNDQLGSDRDFEQFYCDTNDAGGAIVRDRTGRVAVVAMPNSEPSEQCGRRNGHAVVVNAENRRVQIDEGGGIVMDEGPGIVMDETADSNDDRELEDGSQLSNSDLAYCMVARPDSVPIVIRPPSGN